MSVAMEIGRVISVETVVRITLAANDPLCVVGCGKMTEDVDALFTIGSLLLPRSEKKRPFMKNKIAPHQGFL